MSHAAYHVLLGMQHCTELEARTQTIACV